MNNVSVSQIFQMQRKGNKKCRHLNDILTFLNQEFLCTGHNDYYEAIVAHRLRVASAEQGRTLRLLQLYCAKHH